MAVLDRKSAKEAMQPGGEVGLLVRQATAGGRLVDYLGDEMPGARPGLAVNLLAEFDAHIGMLVQQSAFKHVWLLVPKSDIVGWGVMRRAEVSAPNADRTAMTAMGFSFGPIGALLSEGMDQSAARKSRSKPVIGITCRPQGRTRGIYLDFRQTNEYRNLYDFLMKVMPDKLRE